MSKSIASNYGEGNKRNRYDMNRVLTLNDSNAPRLSPALAVEIGLNESILFLQIEFLISVFDNVRDGRRWTYQSLNDWKEKYFCFWSESTIDRALKSLKKQGLIYVEDNYNQKKYDRTRWYSINFEAAAKLKSISIKGYETPFSKSERAVPERNSLPQNGTGFRQNGTTIPETITETPTETNSEPFAVPIGNGKKSNESDRVSLTAQRILEKLRVINPIIPDDPLQRNALRQLAENIEKEVVDMNTVVFCAENLNKENFMTAIVPTSVLKHIGKWLCEDGAIAVEYAISKRDTEYPELYEYDEFESDEIYENTKPQWLVELPFDFADDVPF